mgnify:CR=1 FL=1
MDLSQAAFGLDMREVSRIYFISPVLNPQVQAQAIGRARRISQKKPVSVEILVLKDSIDEVILERKEHMTQAEHQQAKSILDVRAIYDWIKRARTVALPERDGGRLSEMSELASPKPVFGAGFGKEVQSDDGLMSWSPASGEKRVLRPTGSPTPVTKKARLACRIEPGGEQEVRGEQAEAAGTNMPRRVRFG